MFLATDAFNVVMSIAVIIIICIIILFLVKLIKYNELKYREEANTITDSLIPRGQMKSATDQYIEKIGSFANFSMFLIDIDDFSGLNEAYGQDRCDRMLEDFAHRVTSFFPRATLTRYGADQILVLERTETVYEEIDGKVKSLLDIISKPYPIGRNEMVPLTCSIGVVVYPQGGTNYKELCQSVEIASYVAKREGGNKYVLYNENLDSEENTNLEYFKEVRRAMQNHEFTLYYQPIINIYEHKLFGFESFLRWSHPELGVLAPHKFLNILEQSGDINYVSKWGLDQIAKKLVEIQENIGANNLCVTYNLSTKQLMSDTIVNDFKGVVHKYHINPKKIILEVGEYAMYEKMDAVKMNLLRLRDIGFRISVDGLGLDYATLSQIEKEPIDVLKLDKGFLEDIKNNFIRERFVSMVVESAEKMGRLVISEGIENFEQIDYVLNNKINYVQGYYFSKPFEDTYVISYINEKEYIDKLENKQEPEYHEEVILKSDTDTFVHDDEIAKSLNDESKIEKISNDARDFDPLQEMSSDISLSEKEIKDIEEIIDKEANATLENDDTVIANEDTSSVKNDLDDQNVELAEKILDARLQAETKKAKDDSVKEKKASTATKKKTTTSSSSKKDKEATAKSTRSSTKKTSEIEK